MGNFTIVLVNRNGHCFSDYSSCLLVWSAIINIDKMPTFNFKMKRLRLKLNIYFLLWTVTNKLYLDDHVILKIYSM